MTNSTLEWIKRAQRTGGSIPAWKHGEAWGPSYPEVTGYGIPTLLAYGETEMALAAAEYLLAVQRVDGAFPGLDGISRAFDTGACFEGLLAASAGFGDERFCAAAEKARGWLETHVGPDGSLRIAATIDKTSVYTCRVDGLLKRDAGIAFWTPTDEWHPRWGETERVHYIAYGLEGLWRAGVREPVRTALKASRKAIRSDGLMPFYVGTGWVAGGSSCLCGTAQMAMLYRWAGMEADGLIAAIERARAPDGGLPVSGEGGAHVSWAAKFYLDSLRAEAQ